MSDREDREVQAMQRADTKIDRVNPDDDVREDWEVPEEIDHWNLNEFGDVLPTDQPIASEHYPE